MKRDEGADEATADGEDDVPKDQELIREDADDDKIRREAKDYAEFLNWKAGEKRLRDEERKMKFRALLKDKERTDKVQAILKDDETKDSSESSKRIGAKRKI